MVDRRTARDRAQVRSVRVAQARLERTAAFVIGETVAPASYCHVAGPEVLVIDLRPRPAMAARATRDPLTRSSTVAQAGPRSPWPIPRPRAFQLRCGHTGSQSRCQARGDPASAAP